MAFRLSFSHLSCVTMSLQPLMLAKTEGNSKAASIPGDTYIFKYITSVCEECAAPWIHFNTGYVAHLLEECHISKTLNFYKNSYMHRSLCTMSAQHQTWLKYRGFNTCVRIFENENKHMFFIILKSTFILFFLFIHYF